MARKITKGRQAKLGWLRSQVHDAAVRSIIENTCAKHGVATAGHLAGSHPKDFDLMCAAIEDLLEQAPPEESFGWMR